MAFDNIYKKSAAMGKKPMNAVLKVNKYENPQMALDLIAHICTQSADIEVSDSLDAYTSVLSEFEDKLKDFSMVNEDFATKCLNIGNEMTDKLLRSSASNIKVAVAGGYSAGKSSLLNKLTGIGNLLPTGVEPVSVVNTYLNCTAPDKKLIIRGENLKHELVLLNDEVLACIQHSSKSKVYIANVLEKVIIDTPAQARLQNFTFIDTPGYNNSANQTESDRHKAENAIEEADAIMWCIDIEAGTITNTDLEMLAKAKGKPIVIMFTKMDKKDENAMKSIVKETEMKCLQTFGNEDAPITVMAISCMQNKLYSSNGMNIGAMFKAIRSKCGERDALKQATDMVESLFNEEMEASTNQIDKLEELRLELVEERDKANNMAYKNIEIDGELKKGIKEVLLDNYSEIVDKTNKRWDLFIDVLFAWKESLDREQEWSKKQFLFGDTSTLKSELSKAYALFYKTDKQIDDGSLKISYWENDYRKEIYDNIVHLVDFRKESEDSSTNDIDEQYNDIIAKKKAEKELKECLTKYRPRVLRELQQAYYTCMKKVEQRNRSLQSLEKENESDVFAAISGDSMARFLSCFSNGVDLTKFNKDGYSPLTWAVRSGNNEMVKFFINHDADLELKDGRGYNALETATMCHYQDICELLMDADPGIVSRCGNLRELAQKNNFVQWISQVK